MMLEVMNLQSQHRRVVSEQLRESCGQGKIVDFSLVVMLQVISMSRLWPWNY